MLRLLLGGAPALALVLACGPGNAPDPRYDPARSLLEVVSVLRRHVPDDTYRFPPERDFTGRNVYRASLLRLENFETAHADALRAGHMDDVLAFSKGRALERLRAFDLAAASYREAARREGPLFRPALSSAALCDALAEATRITAAANGDAAARSNEVFSAYETRVALLEALQPEARDNHYGILLREEMEQADLERARQLVAMRKVLADGDVRALGELQRVAMRHRDSKLANRHLLSLADLYADLSAEYVEQNPPESLSFDPPAFQDLVEAASRLYEAVANQDGTTEKLEAQSRLEAFLAFTLRVDRDRFSR
jgi:hypothetical protein